MRGILTAVLLLMLLGGCTSGPDSVKDSPAVPATVLDAAELSASLPPLPPGDAPGASASSLLLQVRSGSFTWDRSANTNPVGANLELLAGPLDYSWALYSFDVGGYDIASLSIDAEMTDPDNCWYVFADYDSQHWIFVRAVSTSQEDLFMPQRELTSPDGTFYFGLICYGSTAVINSVTAVVPRGDWISHAIVEGTPDHHPSRLGGAEQIGDDVYIAYIVYDTTPGMNSEIRLARSTVDDPQSSTQWVTSGVFAPGSYLVDELVMAPVAGRPALSWIIYNDQSLWYGWTGSLEPAGLADWTHTALLEVDFIGLLDLTEVDGLPALVYAQQNVELHMMMHYSYAETAEPEAPLDWVDTEALELLSFEIDELELTQVNGTAALAFNTRAIPGFIYAYCDSTAPAGPGNWVPTLIGEYSSHINGNLPSVSVTEIGGNPSVLFQSRVTGLIFASALVPEPLGFTDWRGHTLTTDVFNAQSLAHTGEGWLACCIDNTGKLMTYLSTTAEPQYTRDWREAAAANVGTSFTSIFAVSSASGAPMVIYIDEADNSMKCARYIGQ